MTTKMRSCMLRIALISMPACPADPSALCMPCCCAGLESHRLELSGARDLLELARQQQSLASYQLCCWPGGPLLLQMESTVLQMLQEMQRVLFQSDLGSARRIQGDIRNLWPASLHCMTPTLHGLCFSRSCSCLGLVDLPTIFPMKPR